VRRGRWHFVGHDGMPSRERMRHKAVAGRLKERTHTADAS
jgi:hypothetical protein